MFSFFINNYKAYFFFLSVPPVIRLGVDDANQEEQEHVVLLELDQEPQAGTSTNGTTTEQGAGDSNKKRKRTNKVVEVDEVIFKEHMFTPIPKELTFENLRKRVCVEQIETLRCERAAYRSFVSLAGPLKDFLCTLPKGKPSENGNADHSYTSFKDT